jgi:hypothetical protein
LSEATVSEIIKRLNLVLKNEMSREEVSDWASDYVMTDNPAINDKNVWDLLIKVSGIDLLDSPTSYLHNGDDIVAWIKQATEFL